MVKYELDPLKRPSQPNAYESFRLGVEAPVSQAVGQTGDHPRRERLGAQRTAEVARAMVRLRDRGIDGVDDPPAGRSEFLPAPALLQPCGQHRRRLDERPRGRELP